MSADATLRPFDPASDYPGAAELLCAVNRHDGVDWLPDAASLEHDLAHDGSFRPSVDALVAESGGRMAGLVTTAWRQRGDKVVHRIELVVRPEARRHGIGGRLLAWAEGHIADRVASGEAGPAGLTQELGGWADDGVPGSPELAASHGYRAVRYGMDMLRPLTGPAAASIPDVPLPPGIELRPVVPADHRRIWEADVEAFRDHWEAATRTDADFDWWFSLPNLDTSLWQVAWEGDEVVGSVFVVIDADENARLGVNRGWLHHVSTRRPWRRRGVASALIAASLRALQARGVDEAALGVDTENTSGAVRVYERMGFVRHHTGVHYRKSLAIPARASS
ncbi:MAG TPA: GNAT family N-acetyltransferase [Candidatus Limnocylindrales bacterium]|nr:GNAT family N-acetyltransferase [Candidatus Limnocylindrales bacterium]